MAEDRPKKLNSIKSKFLQRSYSLAKMGLKAGANAAGNSLNQMFADSETKQKIFDKYMTAQMKVLTKELGQLKGSLMKAGQMLSVYGEHLLPKEANQIIKSLQFQSPPLDWSEIEKVLIQELGEENLKLIKIETEPHAAASLGQVHKAKIIESGETVALKIQYPGVDKAIDTDLTFLKSFLKMTDLLPNQFESEEIFDEVKVMLRQELDYFVEAEHTDYFFHLLKSDPRYICPRLYRQFSSQRVLCTQFIEGFEIDSPEVQSLSLERRNKIGQNYLELYMKELFQYGKVQTDPHFGNYRIQIDDQGDKLVLFDFGAVRVLDEKFVKAYFQMVNGSFENNREELCQGAIKLGLLEPQDSEDLKNIFIQLCLLVTEPFDQFHWKTIPHQLMSEDGVYDWPNSDLPHRVRKLGPEMVKSFKLRTPPRELVFIDRKLGGAFVFLSGLGCKMNSRPILEKIYNQYKIRGFRLDT